MKVNEDAVTVIRSVSSHLLPSAALNTLVEEELYLNAWGPELQDGWVDLLLRMLRRTTL